MRISGRISVIVFACVIVFPLTAEAKNDLPVGSSSRFMVAPAMYTPTINPALLGFITNDRIYYWGPIGLKVPGENEIGEQLVDGYEVKQSVHRDKQGYMIPIADQIGIAIEWGTEHFGSGSLMSPTGFDYNGSMESLGTHRDKERTISAGFRFHENVGVGYSIRMYITDDEQEIDTLTVSDPGTYVYFDLGHMITLFDNRFVADAMVTYTNEPQRYIDFSTNKILDGVHPLIVDGSILGGFFGNRLLLSLRTTANIHLDSRTGHQLLIQPIVDYTLFEIASIRAGGYYSHMLQADEFATGRGAIAGISVRIWRIDLTVNAAIGTQPMRLLPGAVVNYADLAFELGFSPVFVKR